MLYYTLTKKKLLNSFLLNSRRFMSSNIQFLKKYSELLLLLFTTINLDHRIANFLIKQLKCCC